nr:MAG TPA: hypothetical protein [Caudoviricetes sp.]
MLYKPIIINNSLLVKQNSNHLHTFWRYFL